VSDDPPPPRAVRAMRERVRELSLPLAGAIRTAGPHLCVASGGTARALGRLVVGMRGMRAARSINQLEVPTAELRTSSTP